MGKIEKLIKKVLSGKQISYSDAEKILLMLGFSVKATGSHHVFRKKGFDYNVSLKKETPVVFLSDKNVEGGFNRSWA